MPLESLRKWISGKKENKAENLRKQREILEMDISEDKEEVYFLFDHLTEGGRELCLRLLGETKYTLEKTSIVFENEEDAKKLIRILSIIKKWRAWDKRDCLIRLCTKYNIEQTFVKTQSEADTEEEEFEIMCEDLDVKRENERRRKEAKKNKK